MKWFFAHFILFRESDKGFFLSNINQDRAIFRVFFKQGQ